MRPLRLQIGNFQIDAEPHWWGVKVRYVRLPLKPIYLVRLNGEAVQLSHLVEI